MVYNVTLEWQQSSKIWTRKTAKLQNSHLGNSYVKHNEQVYVFPNLKEGSIVVTKKDGKWVKCGRITHNGTVFLGEGMSYDEYSQTPEGLEDGKRLLESLWKSKGGD
jgi:hypothetical protein